MLSSAGTRVVLGGRQVLRVCHKGDFPNGHVEHNIVPAVVRVEIGWRRRGDDFAAVDNVGKILVADRDEWNAVERFVTILSRQSRTKSSGRGKLQNEL